MHIFYINGYAESGKDTFVTLVSAYCNVKNTSTIDNIKVLCKKYLGWDGAKDARGRKLLAAVKQASTEYNEGPIKAVRQDIDKSIATGVDILFIHVREVDQMLRMQKLYGGSTLEIQRDTVQSDSTETQFREDARNYVYDYTIDNNGPIESLDKYAQEFAVSFIN